MFFVGVVVLEQFDPWSSGRITPKTKWITTWKLLAGASLPRAPNIGSSGPGNNDDIKQAKRGGGRVNKEQGINKNIEKHMEK